MEQKNTIVKCARRNCLWNYHGTCDRYVIPISADGQCGAFVETAPIHEEIDLEALAEAEELYQGATEMLAQQGAIIIPTSSEPMRGQREKCDFYEDGCVDPEIVNEVCQPFHLCDTQCRHWQLDSYSEWVCGCMTGNVNPHGYCPHYDDGEEE